MCHSDLIKNWMWYFMLKWRHKFLNRLVNFDFGCIWLPVLVGYCLLLSFVISERTFTIWRTLVLSISPPDGQEFPFWKKYLFASLIRHSPQFYAQYWVGRFMATQIPIVKWLGWWKIGRHWHPAALLQQPRWYCLQGSWIVWHLYHINKQRRLILKDMY